MSDEGMIEFTTVVDDGEKSFIVTIPVQSVLIFSAPATRRW
jgi:hypothetical protein